MDNLQQHSEIKVGTPKNFGLTFAFIFGVIAIWPLLFGSGGIRLWAISIAIILVLISLIFPNLLAPLNQLWFKFGMMLGKIMNPVIMTLVFVLTVVPTGIIMRMLGKRPLQLDPPKEGTLWKSTEGEKSSFRNQF